MSSASSRDSDLPRQRNLKWQYCTYHLSRHQTRENTLRVWSINCTVTQLMTWQMTSGPASFLWTRSRRCIYTVVVCEWTGILINIWESVSKHYLGGFTLYGGWGRHVAHSANGSANRLNLSAVRSNTICPPAVITRRQMVSVFSVSGKID